MAAQHEPSAYETRTPCRLIDVGHLSGVRCLRPIDVCTRLKGHLPLSPTHGSEVAHRGEPLIVRMVPSFHCAECTTNSVHHKLRAPESELGESMSSRSLIASPSTLIQTDSTVRCRRGCHPGSGKCPRVAVGWFESVSSSGEQIWIHFLQVELVTSLLLKFEKLS